METHSETVWMDEKYSGKMREELLDSEKLDLFISTDSLGLLSNGENLQRGQRNSFPGT